MNKGRIPISKEEAEKLREDMGAGRRRGAYAVVFEDQDLGRERPGWYLGIAVERSPGYHQLAPGYGPYDSREDGQKHAEELNEKLGLTPKEAALIVASTMFGEGVER